MKSRLIDISLKGALVSIDSEISIKKGDQCTFSFTLTDSDINLTIESHFVFIKENQFGIKFKYIDLESMIHLRRLVELNIGDPDIIQDELFFLVTPQ